MVSQRKREKLGGLMCSLIDGVILQRSSSLSFNQIRLSLHKCRLRSSLARTIDAARLAIILRVPTLSKTWSAIRSSSRRASQVSMGNVDHSPSRSTTAPKTWKESALQ